MIHRLLRTDRPPRLPILGLLAVVLAACVNTAGAAETYPLDLPARALATTLDSLANTSGLKLLYAEDTVRGKQSPALRGRYTAQEALKKALAGSGLEAQSVGDDMIAVNETATEPDPEEAATVLPEMTVTASPVDETSLTAVSLREARERLDAVPGGTTLVDGERTRESASYDVSDTLAYVPGLYVGMGSGYIGGGARISMRGSDVNSSISPILGVKVLRDGMPITTANGATDTEAIDLYAIDYIEVYRGANALEYGAAQLGGAINIVSPTGYTAQGLRFGMTAGSYNFFNPTISAGHVFDNGLDAYGSFAYVESDSFRRNAEQQHFFGYGNIGYRWNEKNETRFHVEVQDHDYDLPIPLTKAQLEQDPKQNQPGGTVPQSGFPVYRFALQHTTRLDGGDRLDVGGYYYQKEFCFPCDPTTDFGDDWHEVGFNLRHVYHHQLFGLDNQFTWGGIWQRMWIEDRKETRREDEDYFNQELFAENKMSLNNNWIFVLGLQSVYRDNEVHRTFGDVSFNAGNDRASEDFWGFNPKAGFIWEPMDRLQLYGNVSRSWELPRLRHLNLFTQTPPLEEQTATTIEIGTRGEIKYLNWDLSIYRAWLDSEVLVVESPPLSQNFITANADATLHTGIELGLESSLPLGLLAQDEEVRLRGTYTWNYFRFDGDLSFGDNQLPGIPEHVGRFELLYRHPSGISIGPTVQAASTNWVDFANTLRADPYALLGARMAYDTEHFRLFVEGRNLTDEHYASSVFVMADAGGADQAQFNPSPTASVFGGVELRW